MSLFRILVLRNTATTERGATGTNGSDHEVCSLKFMFGGSRQCAPSDFDIKAEEESPPEGNLYSFPVALLEMRAWRRQGDVPVEV